MSESRRIAIFIDPGNNLYRALQLPINAGRHEIEVAIEYLWRISQHSNMMALTARLAEARGTLLDDARRSAYDTRLREQLHAELDRIVAGLFDNDGMLDRDEHTKFMTYGRIMGVPEGELTAIVQPYLARNAPVRSEEPAPELEVVAKAPVRAVSSMGIRSDDQLADAQKQGRPRTKSGVVIRWAIVVAGLLVIVYVGSVFVKAQRRQKIEAEAFLDKEEVPGAVLLSDDFMNNNSGWQAPRAWGANIEGGKYVISMQRKLYKKSGILIFERWDETDEVEPDKFYGWWDSPRKVFSDTNMIVEMKMDRVEGAEDGDVGILFGSLEYGVSFQGYAFMMNRAGAYRWVRVSAKGGKYRIMDAQNKRTLNTNFGMETVLSGVDSNVRDDRSHILRSLKVVRNRNKVMLYSNNRLLDSFTNYGGVINGKVGFAVERGLNVDLDRFAVFALRGDR